MAHAGRSRARRGGNADGYACEKPHPAGEIEHAGSPYNVIENHVPLQALVGSAAGTWTDGSTLQS